MKSNNVENITKTIDRLSLFLDSQGMSFNKLSLMIGVSNSYFYKMVRNRASVGSDILEKIVRIYPNLSSEWLLTGKGTMLKEIDSNNSPQSSFENELNFEEFEKKREDIRNTMKKVEENSDENAANYIKEMLAKMESVLTSNRKLFETAYRLSKSNEKLANTVDRMATFIGENRTI